MIEDDQKRTEKFGKKTGTHDKRKHPRKNCGLKVNLKSGAINDLKRARDISLGGIFIETDEEFTVGQEISLSIPFTNQDHYIQVTGKVVRIEKGGVGIQFDVHSIDIE